MDKFFISRFSMFDKRSERLVTMRIAIKTVSIQTLTQTKRFALRRGLWYKALNRLERVLIDLTVRYVVNIRSAKLAKVVTAIVEKLQKTESVEDRLMRTLGLTLARKVSNMAVSWGYCKAKDWAFDLEFARFLVFTYGNVGGS